jgi:hypothetical protein
LDKCQKATRKSEEEEGIQIKEPGQVKIYLLLCSDNHIVGSATSSVISIRLVNKRKILACPGF